MIALDFHPSLFHSTESLVSELDSLSVLQHDQPPLPEQSSTSSNVQKIYCWERRCLLRRWMSSIVHKYRGHTLTRAVGYFRRSSPKSPRHDLLRGYKYSDLTELTEPLLSKQSRHDSAIAPCYSSLFKMNNAKTLHRQDWEDHLLYLQPNTSTYAIDQFLKDDMSRTSLLEALQCGLRQVKI
ncbi:uncharacterized protein CANTADRAFT_270298 [Suhomyces tanzawaensis NRRL Y-17324]|uniref:Uncharacterized protein n=1 Tax=Suhomyces tanzawaensis NRRL Y-17324 TaxID=984487 RepID=A0A1E4SGH5_9ASCO|nr:uncharacterized protein CANTADRAFT_270298 [Suhomyces tanzawaensis NRRL Y-17324]ODV78613.1 hypothetical protein CANTADRAFT_270298 [Suhomyces tanzawaensis NRRL Y-17324]